MSLLSCNDQDDIGRSGRIVRIFPEQHPDLLAAILAEDEAITPADFARAADLLERIEQHNHRARLAAAGGR